jgi:hypothetical protein
MAGLGHQEAFLRVRAKRRLSVQSRDLRGDAAQRARRADSGPFLFSSRSGDVRPLSGRSLQAHRDREKCPRDLTPTVGQ